MFFNQYFAFCSVFGLLNGKFIFTVESGWLAWVRYAECSSLFAL